MTATATTLTPRQQRESRQAFLKRIYLIILQILMTILLVTFLVPTMWMVTTSLKSSIDVMNAKIIIPDPPQWVNYMKVFTEVPFGLYAWNTLSCSFW